MQILVTGGAGFIGSALVRYLVQTTPHQVINVDALTYAGNLKTLHAVASNPQHIFIHADITDAVAMQALFEEYEPDIVMHLAAETHVDRSIDSAAPFIQTNIVGTYVLLEAARHYFQKLPIDKQQIFRFHHISTDEVYGDLENPGTYFTEQTPYAPSSPYSASKASADHLVRAWHRTYGFPILITNCSNNYGPYQYPEKLIPLIIRNALLGKPLPIYGDGMQIRDWLYVDDHVHALYQVVTEGKIGETYNIGGHNEQSNKTVVLTICEILDSLRPLSQVQAGQRSYADLIRYVTDRPGHDRRYAIDARKIQQDLGWQPQETFTTGLYKTVAWYLDNQVWCDELLEKQGQTEVIYPQPLKFWVGKNERAEGVHTQYMTEGE